MLLLSLAPACRCIDPAAVETFACAAQADCDEGLTCCADHFCRDECPSCVAGLECSGNAGQPCFRGVVTCPGDVFTCVDGSPAAVLTDCGNNQICDGDGGCR